MKVYVDENPNTNNIVMSMSIVLSKKKTKNKKSTRGHDYYTEALQHYGSFSMI